MSIDNAISEMCDEIRVLGEYYETKNSNNNPIEAACNAANAELCWRLAETIRFSLTGVEK